MIDRVSWEGCEGKTFLERCRISGDLNDETQPDMLSVSVYVCMCMHAPGTHVWDGQAEEKDESL